VTITEDEEMALSAAERKRQQVERERARAKSKEDLTYSVPRVALGAWLDEHDPEPGLVHFDMCYNGMNREPPSFKDDSDPVSRTHDFVFPSTEDGEPSYRGALGRAELEVDLLIEAAKTLATMINAYKRDVVSNRVRQIEDSELDDRDNRASKLKEIMELNKALERLDKSIRVELPQWQLRS